MTQIFKKVFAFFASYGLSIVLLLLLMLLTFLGTLQQVDEGLYQVQQRYFGSLFVVHWIGQAIPLPLPGAYLLLLLAFVNVTCGGIVRARKGWAQSGILIAHAGILLLLVAGLLTYEMGVRGQLTLYEGEQASRFESGEEWEIVITGPGKEGKLQERVIPARNVGRVSAGHPRTFFSQSLPFDFSVTEYARNAQRGTTADSPPAGASPVNGEWLKPLATAKDAGENLPGARAVIKPKQNGEAKEFLFCATDETPVKVSVDNSDWTFRLRRRGWALPFAVRLDKFIRELHPGTEIAKSYSSDVTRIEGDAKQAVHIAMNEPMRYRGYTFYQSSWGPPNAGPHDRLYSSLAVVRNPAEQLPVYACYVIALGLTIHFVIKLGKHLRAQQQGART